MEQERLLKKFADEEDIIVEKGLNYYVKGRLQPTKTLGDYYLKHKEFNEPPINLEEKYARKKIENFKGPYIDHIPEIQIHQLTEDDEFLTLATDGLWDWLSGQEVAKIIEKNRNNKEQIVDALWKEALTKAGERKNLNFNQVLDLPDSIRRTIHDDITILVVDLKNQYTYNQANHIKIKDNI